MSQEISDDWNPLDEATLNDQRKAYDMMREQCPVAYSKFLGWSLFQHTDTAAVLADPQTFVNDSKFPAIPNGLNPPQHTVWYQALSVFFGNASMATLEPRIRIVAGQMIEAQLASGKAEIVEALITPYVFKSLCVFLGWPVQQWKMLSAWVYDNQVLALHPNAHAGKALADNFSELVLTNLELHRAVSPPNSTDHPAMENAEKSTTDELMQTKVNDQILSDETITTVLRNWVAGHGTNADALGIVLKHVAEDTKLQELLRLVPSLVPAAIEEILRLDGPLVANRRSTTREIKLQGRTIPKDASLTLMWIAANRDPHAFNDACEFKLERDNSESLVWGQGIHLCLGAPLARLEIRVVLEELLARTTHFELADEKPPRKAYPGNGFATLSMRFA